MKRLRFYMPRRMRRIAPWWRRFRRNGYRPDRCDHCGHGFHWSRDANGNRDGKHYHGPCLSYLTWRRKAEHRLDVLAVVCEVAELSARDVQGVVENRATCDAGRVATGNACWSVFYDLKKRAEMGPTP